MYYIIRNPHIVPVRDFGYEYTTELYIKIVLFWFVIFNLEVVHIVLRIKFHLLLIVQLSVRKFPNFLWIIELRQKFLQFVWQFHKVRDLSDPRTGQPSIRAISLIEPTPPSSSLFFHLTALWIICLDGFLISQIENRFLPTFAQPSQQNSNLILDYRIELRVFP